MNAFPFPALALALDLALAPTRVLVLGSDVDVDKNRARVRTLLGFCWLALQLMWWLVRLVRPFPRFWWRGVEVTRRVERRGSSTMI